MLSGSPLFRSQRSGPPLPDLIRRVVQQARIRLCLSDSTALHALRHSFATLV